MAASTTNEENENFVKIIKENTINIKEKCQKYKQNGSGIEEFAQRSLEKLKRLSDVLNEDKKESNSTEEYAGQCLQLYAQVLLDVTFCEENILVDGVFAEKNAKVRVHKLMSMLRHPEVVCQHCFPDKMAKDLLGEEILECLLWRRGALLYMYCHTVQEDEERLKNERQLFLDNCKEGALYLRDMLQVRTPLQEDRENVFTNSEDVFTLLKNGVFSETHVLSMIYMGELCYWHKKHSESDTKDTTDSASQPQSNSSDFNAEELGSGVLSSYLSIVNGPLKNHGWSTGRATQLLEGLQSSAEEQSESQK